MRRIEDLPTLDDLPPVEPTEFARERKAANRPTSGRQWPEVRPASAYKRERVDWLWPGRIPRGKFVLLDGQPGQGKTAALLDLAARLSRRLDLPDGGAAPLTNTLFFTFEDGIEDTLVGRIEDAEADVDRVFPIGAAGVVLDVAGLRWIEETIREFQAGLIVFDPLVAALPPDCKVNSDQDVRRVLAGLADVLERTRAACVGIRHLNKMTSGSALSRGGGSIGLAGAARSVLLVTTDPDDERDGRILSVVKCNLARKAPSLRFKLEHEPFRLTWGGECRLGADALVSGLDLDEDERGEREEARVFLRETLRDAPMLSTEIEKQARQAGHSEKTLRRAKRELGIKSHKDGAKGAWRWHCVGCSCEPCRARGDS